MHRALNKVQTLASSAALRRLRDAALLCAIGVVEPGVGAMTSTSEVMV